MTDDPARDIAKIVANSLLSELVGEQVGDGCTVKVVQLHGTTSVLVELDDGRNFFVDVEEEPST